MRILLLGAGGFIGRHILAEFLAAGHEVTAVARSTTALATAFPKARWLAVDLAQNVAAEAWADTLDSALDVDVIVNAAGVLRGRDMAAVHVTAPAALYAAARAAGVNRAILISAISARADVSTDYAQSKLRGEDAVRMSGLAWTILRPSLVYGEGSYGGTSLIRGMAAWPFLIPIPGDGAFEFTPIHVRDLALAVRIASERPEFSYQTLEPVGPETMSLKGILTRYRAWMGLGKARSLALPMPLMHLLGRIGDMAGDGPISTASLRQTIAGNAGNSALFADAIGFTPRSLAEAFTASPAQVQDRWHARLFFLAPAIRAVLIILWVASGLLGLFCAAPQTTDVLHALGWPMALATPMRVGASLLDLAMAIMVLMDARGHRATFAQSMVIIAYTSLIGWALPGLWYDPMGPLIKNLPILALVLVHGAIADKR